MENKTPTKLTPFAENIKYLRKKAGLSQMEVAKAIGVTRSAYAYYEIAKTEPKLETLTKIADMYNMSSYDIVKKSLQSADGVSQEEKYEIELNGFNDAFNDLTDIEKVVVLKLRIMSREQRAKILDEILG